MADVTDPAWRALMAECGKPDITWTEFVSSDGLYHTLKGRSVRETVVQGMEQANPLLRDLQFTEAERPIVAQLFTGKPDMLAYAVKLAHELGFDGVDLNMGCPDASIERQGSGSAMIKTPELAQQLIRAAKQAALEAQESSLQNSSYRSKVVEGPMPISVKTRIGYNKVELEPWLTALLEAEPAAITLHLRTRKEMSKVPAHWELMKDAVAIRDRVNPKVLMLGNGDIATLEEARRKVEETGCDGVMIGRGMFGNPWVFAGRKPEDTPLPEKLAFLVKLAHAFEALRPAKHFPILKKHIKAFVTGFDGAADLRAKLMEAENAAELEQSVRALVANR